MNITFVNDSIGYGGAAKVMMVIAKGLKEKGHDVSIINLNVLNGQVSQNIDGFDVVTSNDIKYRKGLLCNLEYVKFTIDAAKDFHSDVLIGFKTLCNFCASAAGHFLRIPSIVSERADPFTSFAHLALSTRLKLWVINRADGAVFQTYGASEFYSKKLQEKGTIIPNPILLNSPVPEISYDNMPKTIVSLGRISNHQKRLDILVKAFALFHQTHPDYTLVVYGSGEDEDKLNGFISDNNVEPFVRLMGISRNSLQDLSKEGMFVISSDYEGISNALLEAMAVGLPVVSTDHSPGGARLLITDHENGLLVPMRNHEALAKAMSEFADNPELAFKCGQNAKKVLKRFEVSKIVDMLEMYIVHISQ